MLLFVGHWTGVGTTRYKQTQPACPFVAWNLFSLPKCFLVSGVTSSRPTVIPDTRIVTYSICIHLHRSAPRLPPTSCRRPAAKRMERPEAIVGPAAYVAPELLLIYPAAPPLCIHSDKPWPNVVPRRPPSLINISNTNGPRFQIGVAGAPEPSHTAALSCASRRVSCLRLLVPTYYNGGR